MSNLNCSKDELLNLLESFIRFTSVQDSPNQKLECIDWIHTAFLSEFAGTVQRGECESSPWLLAGEGDADFLIFAHVDVVPAPEKLFTLKVEGDTAYGRGVSDMKGHILPCLMAFRDACREGSQPRVSVLITTDEEVAGKTIPHLLKEGIISPKAAFTPDSNDKGVVHEHKGIVWGTLTAHGRGGHGAYPWDAENPIWLLSKALQDIQKAFPTGEHDDWQMTVSPTLLHGSTAGNQIPNVATCNLDIRFVPEECSSPDEALQKVRSILPDGCTLEKAQEASPLYTDPNAPALQEYKKIAESVLGSTIPFKREHGGTDARYFAEAGIPAFLYGPKGGGLHSDREWVSINSLQKHYEIYRRIFLEM